MARINYQLDQCPLALIRSTEALAARLSTSLRPMAAEDLESLANAAEAEEQQGYLQDVRSRIHILLSCLPLPSYARILQSKGFEASSGDQKSGQDNRTLPDTMRFNPPVEDVAVAAFFENQLECSRDVADLLAQLLTVDGYLPAGSCTSPILSYLNNRNMFDEIARFAEEKGLKMSLISDDKCVSVQVSSPRGR